MVVALKGHACRSPQAALVSRTIWLIAALLNLHPKGTVHDVRDQAHFSQQRTSSFSGIAWRMADAP